MLEVADPHACRECPLLECKGLRPLADTQREYIQTIKQAEHLYERGDVLLSEGEETHHLFTVLEGVLIRFRTLDDGRRQIVNFMFPGDLVGLQGAFDEPSSHSVEALRQSRLCVFKRVDFVHLVKAHPRLGYDVTWLAAKEEKALEGHIVTLGQRSAKERVVFLAVWLLERAIMTGIAREGNALRISVTQTQIADMLGLSLVHTNRTIRALAKENLVHWEPRELCVPDMAKAADFAGFENLGRSKRPWI